jgi:cytochrome P450
MTSQLAATGDSAALYPPTVTPRYAPLDPLRYFLTFVRNPLRVMPGIVYHEPICQYRNMLTWVSDPALIKTILLDNRDNFPKTRVERRVLGPLLGKGILIAQDPDWRWQRQTAAPIFRHADILQYAPAMVAAAEQTVTHWRASAPGTTQPIDDDMTRVTFRVISDTMLQGGDPAEGQGIEQSNQDYAKPIAWPLAYAVLGLPTWLPFPGRAARERAEQAMRSSVASIVRGRRKNPGARDDLLVRLLRAKDPDTDQPMSDEQVVDNLLTFLLAGHETTARALSWSLYLIARSPDWERRLLEEVREVSGEGPIQPEHIDRLTEVTKVLKEAMRLYPPISSIMRIVKQDTELGGRKLAAGSLVVIPMYIVHRHRRLWDDPDRFDPDRFTREREAKYSRYQFMPFGAGPRSCIGGSFSMVEAVAMLATFVRAARFEVPEGYVPTPVSGVTLRPSGGMPLKVWPRQAA